jgi:phosphatidylserine/phosphatidylglycerophosphate/cardiolipin synthase-like enzyme
MKLNTHVKYVHSKFLLADPLSEEPVVVAGSANFSNPSTVSNDENMVLIKGNLRVADIYFTEFMRIFYHYYFRSVFEELKNKSAEGGDSLDAKATIFLDPDDGWLDKYKPGTFRSKRVRLFVEMSKAKRLKVT